MLSDMKWENVPMRPQQIKIRSKYVEKKIDSKCAYMASVSFLCRWLCGILLDGCMYIWVWACVGGGIFLQWSRYLQKRKASQEKNTRLSSYSSQPEARLFTFWGWLDVLSPREARGRGWTTPEALEDASHCDFLAHEAVVLSGLTNCCLEPSSTLYFSPLVGPFHLHINCKVRDRWPYFPARETETQ